MLWLTRLVSAIIPTKQQLTSAEFNKLGIDYRLILTALSWLTRLVSAIILTQQQLWSAVSNKLGIDYRLSLTQCRG